MLILYTFVLTSRVAVNDVCIKSCTVVTGTKKVRLFLFLFLHSCFTKVRATPFTNYKCTHCCSCLQCTASTGWTDLTISGQWATLLSNPMWQQVRVIYPLLQLHFNTAGTLDRCTCFILQVWHCDTKGSFADYCSLVCNNQGALHVFFVLFVHKEGVKHISLHCYFGYIDIKFKWLACHSSHTIRMIG